jgi:hypothetical protein
MEDTPLPEEYIHLDYTMNRQLGKKRSVSSFRGEQSESSHGSGKEGKTPDARNPKYEKILANAGIYMDPYDPGPRDACKSFCHGLLNKKRETPQNTLFSDKLFNETCARVRRRNETIVFADITPLIVPRTEILRSYGATNLKHLIKELNVAWDKSVPIATNVFPQPDYFVGFGTSALTKSQHRRLEPDVGNFKNTFFMATEWMFFPFFTCEIKCGNETLNIADRQNARSASVALRGTIELYRRRGRQSGLHQRILVFSVSHDHETVMIYGHYALIEGDQISYHRHSIKKFDFTSEDG